MLRGLSDWVLGWAESPFSLWALFGIAVAESSCFPIPPDVLLIALTLAAPEQGLWLAAVTTAGSALGGLLGYVIGWLGGRPLLLRWMGPARVQAVHEAFQRYEAWAILVAGFTPVPYKVFAIGAGAFYVNVWIFLAASLISRGARFVLVAGTLQLFGPRLQPLIERYFDLLTIAFVILLIGGFWGLRVWQRRHARGHPPVSHHAGG